MISRDSGSFPRLTQDRSKAGWTAAKLRELFGKVAEALTGKPTPYVATRRKRTDETRGAFKMTARIARRAARLPKEAYAVATAYLADTLDWLNQWHHHDAEEENSHTIQSDHLYPHL